MTGGLNRGRDLRGRGVAVAFGLVALLLAGCSPPSEQGLTSAGLAILSSSPSWTSSATESNTGMSWGDWDGDGDLDLAVASSSEPNRVYENTSSSFSLAWSAPLTEESYGIAWGDADGDGDLDLAVATKDNPNRIYLGDGAGGLGLGWSSPESDDSRDVAWADVDGDSDLDLAFANSSSQANRLYTNDGAGNLTLAWTSTESDESRGLAWGDYDGDGDPDLAVANAANEVNRLYENVSGTLALAWSSPEADDSRGAAWGDVDGDGDLDLAVANHDGTGNRLYSGASGSLALVWTDNEEEDSRGVALGDWDRDGDLDLVAANEAKDQVFLNDGGVLETGKEWETSASGSTGAVAWVDTDGDGALELAVAGDGQSNRLYPNVGDHPPSTVVTPGNLDTTDLAWGDADGDGDLDLAVARDGQATRVYTWSASTLSVLWTAPSASAGRAVAWGDWDDDGDLDLAVGNNAAGNQVWANDGSGSFSLAWTSTETDATLSLAWGDWDNDGDLDLAAGNYLQSNRVYANGGGSLSLAWSSTQTGKTEAVAWGDFDDDLDLDLYVANNNQVDRIYANSGGALAASWSSSSITDKSTGLAVGDLDGDGDLDVAVARDNEANRYWWNSGGSFTSSTLSTEVRKSEDVCAFDHDGDGDLDLWVGNRGEDNQLYLNDGSGSFAWHADSPTSASTYAVACADADGDGDGDLASGNHGQQLRIHENQLLGGPILPQTPTRAWIDIPGDQPAGDALATVQAVTGSTVPVEFVLFDEQSDPVDVSLYYSEAGGGSWQPLTITSGATTALATSPAGTSHSVTWDLSADGLNTDRAALRLVIEPQIPTLVAHPQQLGQVSATSLLFRAWECLPRDADGDGATCDVDCDDSQASIYPGAPESCDSIDSDCDGDLVDGFADFDGDGSPNCVDTDDDGDGDPDATDCADTDAAVYTGAAESCDDIDSDCDGSLVDGFDNFDSDSQPDCVDLDDDNDGDPDVTDCADTDASIYTGAAESCDAVDSDCDGDLVDGFVDTDGDATPDCVDVDDDGDGDPDATDCADLDDSVYTGAIEVVDDGVDQDCDGADTVTCFVDADLDGYGGATTTTADDGDCTDPGESSVDTDCDDGDATIYPTAPETPGDGIDQDCDGFDIGVACFEDLDGDGVGSSVVITSTDEDCDDPGESSQGTDCDDGDPTAFPGAPEIADDGIDQDCNGFDTITCFVDGDGDDFGDGTALADDGDCADAGEASAGGDCDDDDATIYPGAPETPDDGIDQDCDGFDTVTCFVDGDGDGFGSAATLLSADGDCLDLGEAATNGDCDDALASAWPGATEIPGDGIDQDCNGYDTVTCHVDGDGDDFGSPTTTLSDDGDCNDPGETAVGGDCDDASASVYPGAPDTPDDGVDQDCDGIDPVTCFEDLDGDTFGGAATFVADDGDCTDAGEASAAGDCDDGDPAVYTGAPEACDGVDSDCDGDLVDSFDDTDGDGDPDCTDTDDDDDGFPDAVDCGPLDPAVYPLAPETCDAVDSDCDGDLVDGYDDTDGDGIPDCVEQDADGDTFAAVDDCDDADPSIFPGAVETPDDGIDQDCDGFDTVTCQEDLDGDTFGSTSTVLAPDGSCSGAGESLLDTDCDDADPTAFPGAPELADDGVDQDCSGVDTVTCFVDGDGDGVGGSATALDVDGDCTDDAGQSDLDGDCDDADPGRFPGAVELCDAIDSDCDGDLLDEFDDTDEDGLPDCIDPPEDDDEDGDGHASDVDCDDADPAVYPGATEIPDDGTDQDCDGHDTVTCWPDGDGDGWGAGQSQLSADGACGDGLVAQDGDCDDDDLLVFPGADELCNGVDDDCDGEVPLDETEDADGDGWVTCKDCDDGDAATGSGSDEECSGGVDEDCDGLADEQDPDCDGLVDLDGDGFCEDGVDLDGDGACDGAEEPFEQGETGDCDDDAPDVFPGAEELCDGVDSDCDPTGDDGELDADGDGQMGCEGDCDDGDPMAFAGASEICADGVDQDCDRTETDAHDDPECWPAACTDCQASQGPGGAGLAALGLVLLALVGRRRRRATILLAPVALLPALLLPSPAAAASPRDVRSALTAGTCDEARALALELVDERPEDPDAWRLLGDAERCVGATRAAVLAYRRHRSLGGDDPAVPGLLDGLAASLAGLEVRFAETDRPATPGAEVLLDGEGAAPFEVEGGVHRFRDLPTDGPLVVRVRGAGFLSERQEVTQLVPGEVREVELTPRWAGFGELALAGDALVQVAAIGPDGEVPLGTDPVELTAEELEVHVTGGHGMVVVPVTVVRGETTLFDPAPWRPASLRIIGLPAGSAVRVFVEGPEGRTLNREVRLDPTRGVLHEPTGVRVAPPHSIESLLGGTGGIFISHPVLGSGVAAAVLEPGSPNTVSFDLATLGGVPAVQAAYEAWKQRRLEARRRAAQAPVVTGLVAAGAGVAAAVLAGSAVAAGQEVTSTRTLAITASEEGDPAWVDSLWTDYHAASRREQGLLVGSGVLGGVAVTAAGLTITFGAIGQKHVVEVGVWDPEDPGVEP